MCFDVVSSHAEVALAYVFNVSSIMKKSPEPNIFLSTCNNQILKSSFHGMNEIIYIIHFV